MKSSFDQLVLYFYKYKEYMYQSSNSFRLSSIYSSGAQTPSNSDENLGQSKAQLFWTFHQLDKIKTNKYNFHGNQTNTKTNK